MTERYVILDRDGTINVDSDDFIKSPEEWLPLAGSLEAIALLNRHRYKVVVITNQSGIARGLFDLATLAAIHAKMLQLASQAGGHIEAIYFCPHGPNDTCDCRKPLDGLFRRFAADTQAELSRTYAIGDSLRDIQAAESVGAKPILVRTGKGEKTAINHPQLNVPIFDNLYDAATHIVSTS
ncbi:MULTISPECIES: D-glycero-beta-D-manno-heptose 1,7-bisphosphate 7-phosphatase [Methylomonas]|uniref:D,D-heptose 1,7-bisphosphate phosphatase n=2 Tax=Methylomonas TaxID=416 RepID=A0A126T430_9GAMM|nr:MULTISPECIES: D-glycero-beta-D-manno-heptose 1,7-bisphosphate 7-phosphatase [Methylomonas]AMK76843.1 histidinol-phosphatase [Methylomonas denitrificans]OAI03393.1 histidinol-phosphatase [Methylomonas methanica]TCV76961.1 D-alpha,beta-D-heptose 1,7-bisphosphate phosphatase [Methylomonas methanica]